uniref:Uncharacterized protein n=1 Tax=Candidatus Methanophaga sp. ANME-1 ERB7 TaxID=2759913 RepID=A0A7G9Z7D2_9EURY|nr:hypothetical protein LLPGBHFJ_00010 [Methanosarcinales archaeon ANME-1 ERB7]
MTPIAASAVPYRSHPQQKQNHSLILVSPTLNRENLWHFGHRIYLFFPNLILERDPPGIQLYSNSWLHFGHFSLLFIDRIIICKYINISVCSAVKFKDIAIPLKKKSAVPGKRNISK